MQVVVYNVRVGVGVPTHMIEGTDSCSYLIPTRSVMDL